MRIFVFLLILANLLFLAWTQGYVGVGSNPDAFRVQQQLLADQVRVVARDEPPSDVKTEKKDPPVEKNVAEVCVFLNDLTSADVEPFETALAQRMPAFKAVRATEPGASSYWVNIPPLASKQDVDTKVSELKKLKVTEFFVVQESGPNNRAISLGLFSTHEAAANQLEALRVKGVKSAKITERVVKPALISYELRGPESQADALNSVIVEVLPSSKPGVCQTQAKS